MPVISVNPHDKKALRRQIAEFQSLYQMLSRLARESRNLANTYDRGRRWLTDTAPEYHDIAEMLQAMGNAELYRARRLEHIAEQIEQNWDLAMSLKAVCFHDESNIFPLEFGLPIDPIGDPPSEQEIKDMQNG